MHIYVFWRITTVPWIRRYVPVRHIIWTGLVFLLIFVLGRVLPHEGTGFLSIFTELFVMHWMGITFLLFISMFSVDIVTLGGLLLRKTAPALRGYALIAGMVLVIVAIVQGTRPPAIIEQVIYLPSLPKNLDGTVIIALSDMHIGSILGPSWLEARIEQVQAQQPDIVVLLGDTIDRYDPSRYELVPVLRGLSAKYGVWGITGNHDRQSEKVLLLQEAGVRMLHNRWAEIKPGLMLAGVDDLSSRHRSGNSSDSINKALAGRPKGVVVLLSHSPLETEVASSAGADLMLCAHTHGGQIWPFGYLVRRMYPLLAGRYEVNGMPVIVSRGTGTWGPRMRLWPRGEILRITLRNQRGIRGHNTN